MQETCKHCDSLLSVAEEEVEFFDNASESALKVNLVAIWCDECGYARVRPV